VQLFLKLLAQELIDLFRAKTDFVDQRIAEQDREEPLLVVGPRGRFAGAKFETPFSGDPGQRGDEAFSFDHFLLHQFQEPLKSQMGRDGREGGLSVRIQTIGWRGRGRGMHDFMPGAFFREEADFREYSAPAG